MHTKPKPLYPNKAKQALQAALSMPQYKAWIADFMGNHDMTERTLNYKFAGASQFTPAQAHEIAAAANKPASEIFDYPVELKNTVPCNQ